MPEHPPMPPRAPSAVGFLQLSEDSSTSKSPRRGPALPSLMSTRSSASLLRAQRKSFSRAKDDGNLEAGKPERRSSLDDDGIPVPPSTFPIKGQKKDERKPSAANVLMTPQMRSDRLIGNSNPRYRWERYYKTGEELKVLRKPVRKYYERNNYLIQQYIYIDRLLDSSLPQTLLQEYDVDIPSTIPEEDGGTDDNGTLKQNGNDEPTPPNTAHRIKRTKDIYKLDPSEETPLLEGQDEIEPIPLFQPEDDADSGDAAVTRAIYLNFAANTILLVLKIVVVVLSSSLSVLASLVDAALDFLSTFIVWTTSLLISSGAHDTENYPVGRRRLEPLGVLVFSVIMITSFFQVALEALSRLTAPGPHEVVELSPLSIGIMAATVAVKGACWVYCRLIRNSGVQALAQDAATDVVFNIFSIIFPLLGSPRLLSLWWLDPLGGLLLSIYVILNWSRTTWTHVLNLTGRAASADERNILLYLTMRFARSIRYVQGLAAYSSGDRLNVEVDIVLDEDMSLKDSHDVSESLQYVLESVPGVERAFVHTDYKRINLPSHMEQS